MESLLGVNIADKYVISYFIIFYLNYFIICHYELT